MMKFKKTYLNLVGILCLAGCKTEKMPLLKSVQAVLDGNGLMTQAVFQPTIKLPITAHFNTASGLEVDMRTFEDATFRISVLAGPAFFAHVGAGGYESTITLPNGMLVPQPNIAPLAKVVVVDNSDYRLNVYASSNGKYFLGVNIELKKFAPAVLQGTVVQQSMIPDKKHPKVKMVGLLYGPNLDENNQVVVPAGIFVGGEWGGLTGARASIMSATTSGNLSFAGKYAAFFQKNVERQKFLFNELVSQIKQALPE